MNDHVDFISDVSIKFVDKTDPLNFLKRENYSKHILNTLTSNKLNIAEYVQR